MHVDDVGFFDQDAAARRVAVDGAAEKAEGGAFAVGEGMAGGAGAGGVVAHYEVWEVGGGD